MYTNIADSDQVSFPLAPSMQRTTAGARVALDASTGKIVWSTANPSDDTAQAPVTLVNQIPFAVLNLLMVLCTRWTPTLEILSGLMMQMLKYMVVHQQLMGAFIWETVTQRARQSSTLTGLLEFLYMPMAFGELEPQQREKIVNKNASQLRPHHPCDPK